MLGLLGELGQRHVSTNILVKIAGLVCPAEPQPWSRARVWASRSLKPWCPFPSLLASSVWVPSRRDPVRLVAFRLVNQGRGLVLKGPQE